MFGKNTSNNSNLYRSSKKLFGKKKKPIGHIDYASSSNDPYSAISNTSIHEAKGFSSVLPAYKSRIVIRSFKNKLLMVVALVASFVLLLALSFIAWTNRNVKFTLNGEETSVKINTTIEQIIADNKMTFDSGNLVSVSGKLLKEGEGDPYSVKLNDEMLTLEAAAEIKIQGGESIVLDKGNDVLEPYTSEEQVVEPKLKVKGSSGVLAYVTQWPSPGKKEIRHGKTTHEVADGDVIEEVKDLIITKHTPKPANDQKLICLTFDDGPSSYTAKYLEVLNKHKAHATFFNLTDQEADFPDTVKAIISSGSQIASHTPNHTSLLTADATTIQSDLKKSFAAIEKNSGTKTTVVRPPFGNFANDTWLKTAGIMSVEVLWTQDTTDWEKPGTETIIEKALSNVFTGAVILMHDGGGNRDQTLEALPAIIEKLQSDGYKLVTINELMQSDSSIPEDIRSGAAVMPEGSVWPTQMADNTKKS